MSNYQMNAFGLTWKTIVESFSKAIESDFATNSLCGQQVIENEIQIKEGEVLFILSEAAFTYFNSIPLHEVVTFDLSGSSAFWFDFAPDTNSTIKVKITSKCTDNTSLLDCSFNSCADGEEVEVIWDEVSESYFGLLSRQITSSERVIVTYKPLWSALNIPSLKAILRDGVCCLLGNTLYSDSDNSWKLVERFCQSYDKWFNNLQKGWIPPEFKKLKYLEWNGPFRGVRGNRL